jgi:hypothetical protein
MLSFLYRLIHGFRSHHGILPNVLYLSRAHYQQLLRDLPAYDSYDELCRFLSVSVIVTSATTHPHVAWMRGTIRRAAGG